MRENCTYGSEGGEGSALPDPYQKHASGSETCRASRVLQLAMHMSSAQVRLSDQANQETD